MTWIDATVVGLFFLGISLVGKWHARTVKDRSAFFTAAGSLPWWTVAASIIATIISSTSFISLPSTIFSDKGSLTYAQLFVGLMFGKFLTAWLFVRPYYESRDIRTTYDYVAVRLDPRIGDLNLALGFLVNVVTTSLKVLATGFAVSIVLGVSLTLSIAVVLVFSALWAALGGLRTVVWTDFAMFVIFVAGAIIAVVFTFAGAGLPIPDVVRLLDEKGKLVLLDFSTDPRKSYTLWAGVIGGAVVGLTACGQQFVFQRVKACRSLKEARRAFYWAGGFYLLMLIPIAAGLGLTAFYSVHEIPPNVAARLPSEPDVIFMHFIVTQLPTGLVGIIIAAILAAGMANFTSHLAEISDMTVSNVYERYVRPSASETHYLLISRVMLVAWAIVYMALALFFANYQARGLFELALSVPNYVSGAVLGTFLLARIGIGTLRTYIPAMILSLASTWILDAQQVSYFWWPLVAAIVMVAIVLAFNRHRPEWTGVGPRSHMLASTSLNQLQNSARDK